jgi:RNA polymerase sigma-70 factor (ECF subfamily)
MAAAPSATLAQPAPLLPLVAAGDDGAMHQLVRRFEPLVRSIAHRRDRQADSGDDLVQETMFRLWRSAHRFDPVRGSEPTFVAAVARNAAIDMARQRTVRPAVPSADLDALAPAGASPTEHIADAMAVRGALRSLTPDQRELVRLAYFAQLTQQEIAERLGLPLGTVKSRTFQALRVLRATLSRQQASA